MSKLDTELDLRVEIMRAAGIEDDEILRLAGLRHRIAVGDCSELTAEHKRLLFYRYLFENGQLSDRDEPEHAEALAA